MLMEAGKDQESARSALEGRRPDEWDRGRSAAAAPPRQRAWKNAAAGLIVGGLGWVAATRLNLECLLPHSWDTHYGLLVAALLGAALYGTRLRALLWALDGVVCALLLAVSYTPVIHGPALDLVRSDLPRRCPAVVMLSSSVLSDGTPIHEGEDRLLRAMELLSEGYAPQLVITRIPPPRPSALPAVRRQLAALGIRVPVDEVAGYCYNTHDEALRVAKLARARGWAQVLLVTSPMHTRRAAAVFEKAGLPVVVEPAVEHQFDLAGLVSVEDRLAAFRRWLYESVGWAVYRRRGWI